MPRMMDSGINQDACRLGLPDRVFIFREDEVRNPHIKTTSRYLTCNRRLVLVRELTRNATGKLPRIISDNLLWTGGCIEINYSGETVHGHFSIFLIKGSEKTLLVDTGHPANWADVEPDIDAFLDGRPLDYIFVTHIEFPHAGLLPQWLQKFPDLVVYGDVRDFHLYYPQYADRLRNVTVGDRIDLGDREILMVPAIWRDMPSSLWCYDTKDKVLFVSDAFSYLHYHKEGQCDLKTSEHPVPDVKMIQFFNERALQWTKYTDARITYNDIDELLRQLDPAIIAGAHSGIIDTKEEMIPVVKEGMLSGAPEGDFTITKVRT